MADQIPDMEEILARMSQKFLETAQEKLLRLKELLAEFSAENHNDSFYNEFHREIHSLKGLGGTFQMPAITKVCLKFEEYLNAKNQLNKQQCHDCAIYLERLSEVIESARSSQYNQNDDWLGGLPTNLLDNKISQNDDGKDHILLICDSPVIIDELSSLLETDQFKLMCSRSGFEGYRVAMTLRPRIIIIYNGLEDVRGDELLRSLISTETLVHSKFAMIVENEKENLAQDLKTINLLFKKNITNDVLNFIAILHAV